MDQLETAAHPNAVIGTLDAIEAKFGVVGHQDPRKSDRRAVAKSCLPAKFATAGKPG